MPAPHIVLVDDDASILTLLRASLRAGLGATISAFPCAEAALAGWAHLEAPSLLLTDYSMPGMNGLELAAELRRLDGELLIVVLSAVEVPLESPAGISLFLTKPCPPRVLLPALRGLLKLSEPPASVAPGGKLAELRARYVEHLAQVLVGLEALLAAAGTPAGERALRDELHQLAGTAGSYGFSAVTEAAHALRAAVIAREALERCAEGLREALRAAQR
jgi:CheY-like chemotaxis protein/HPt (histidine-containing phosphotransfer) domain-containing protein